jgi:hypothetical protein
MKENHGSWYKRNIEYLKETITPSDPNDSKATKLRKKVLFNLFLILLVCTTGALLLSISFVH